MTAEESVAALLAALGWQDAELEGTPARVAEFLGSYVQGPRPAMSTFPQVFIDGAVIGGYDDLAQLHAEGALASLQ